MLDAAPTPVQGDWVSIEDPFERALTQKEAEDAHNVPAREAIIDIMDYEESVDAAAAAEMLERDHVVKRAPTFRDVAADPTRTNDILHVSSSGNLRTRDLRDHEAMDTYERSEADAARGLMDFLTEVADQVPTHADKARDMLDNLTYIGEKERAEAVAGIAEHWKSWLRENPDRQICAYAGISEGTDHKSDRFLLDSILGHFNFNDFKELEGRLVVSTGELTSHPDDVRVVLLDDWTISGMQMETAVSALRHQAPEYVSSIEMQLVTSARNRIERGKTVSHQGVQHVIPIRSYFLSHEAGRATSFAGDGHIAYETGSHSSVDFDFQDTIAEMKAALDSAKGSDKPSVMPPTTNIPRLYKKARLQHIERYRASIGGYKEQQQEVAV